VAALREAAARSPDVADVHLNLGNTLAEHGQTEEALACYDRVLALQPNHPAAHFNIGNLHRSAGRLEEAAASFRRALVVAPEDAHTHNNLGLVYERQQRLDEAAAAYRQALALDPNHVQAQGNLGNVLRAQGRLDEAIACYERAIAVAPNHGDAYLNLGIARTDQGRHADARDLFEKVLRLEPRSFEAHLNLGYLFRLQGEQADSLDQFRRGLEAAPGRALAHHELGTAYRQIGDLEAAAACHRRALELDPGYASAHYALAETRKLQGRLDEAMDSYDRALALKPDHVEALGGIVHLRQHLCRWDGIEELWRQVRESIAAGTGGFITPFSSLSMPTTPAEQLACARAWAQRELSSLIVQESRPAFDLTVPRPPGRLRIGYLSWGFHQHATAYLMAQLLELHDRGRVEVFAYAYGPDDQSAIRARLRNACEHFADVSKESYIATAQRIYDDRVDVLVDLTGYTLGTRPQILALRPAPIQVSWLGYPGTMGTSSIDSLIADPFIVPGDQEQFYAERVVRLPDCYQINDRRREVSGRMPTRAECGLPENGVVFCCFNQTYKILPEMFGVWMRVLKAVPGSVLWLAEANRWATENLRRAAAERGVAAERLAFAARKDLPDYLVQYRLADLALDTFPYTSHTTASDALWMGCPLAACTGATFASRVSGSILINSGMGDLVADNLRDYERLVAGLATAPGKLSDLRRRLERTRDTHPLFDTPRLVKNLESVYEAMFRERFEGAK
jgi:protein O-GlcNAc transferase